MILMICVYVLSLEVLNKSNHGNKLIMFSLGILHDQKYAIHVGTVDYFQVFSQNSYSRLYSI